jgi:XRE family transcriptional regulator of biofilm formation
MDIAKIDFQKLGHRVRFHRQGKGWTIATLAEKSGVSKAYISDLENGVAGKPNIQYVYSIAVALGITLDDLLEDAKPSYKYKPRSDGEELPPGLADLQKELELSDVEVESLAQINFRGNRPKDTEGWRFLLEALKMLGQRNSQK